MSVREGIGRRADRAMRKAAKLRLKGGILNIQRAQSLEEQAAYDYDTYNNWTSDRWG